MLRKYIALMIILCLTMNVGFYAQGKDSKLLVISEFIQDYMSIKYPEMKLDTLLYVGVERQKMYLFIDGVAQKVYNISTSKKGAGTQYGSNCTPVGMHCIKGKFGAGVPYGGVLVGRKFTGKVVEIEHDSISTGMDAITSRVLTLSGLEEGINKGGEIDTYKRKIYIHGTAEEGLIGKPASHGCIRMKNDDVIELFELIDEGVPTLILDN